MQNPKQWRQQIDHGVGAEHPLYGLFSQLIRDWEQHQEVWVALVRDMESRIGRDRAKLDAIQALLK